MDHIGFGRRASLNKLFLRFDHQFWPAVQERFIALPANLEQRGLFVSWMNLAELTGAPILLSFTSGAHGATCDLEVDDATILQAAMQSLRLIFGPHVPEPVDYRITRWLSDPWALGSYSYSNVTTRSADRLRYATPVHDRLIFAGEAASPHHYGTVHAALLSGQLAAFHLVRRLAQVEPAPDRLPWRAFLARHPQAMEEML